MAPIFKVPTALHFHGAVLPKTIIPVIFCTLWATAVYYINRYVGNFQIPSTVFLSATSLVLSLLLAFRTSTAYDRFWEGRKLWATLSTNTRTLFLIMLTGIRDLAEESAEQETKLNSSSDFTATAETRKCRRFDAARLCLGFYIALKNQVRGEFGLQKKDGTPRPEYEGILPASVTIPNASEIDHESDEPGERSTHPFSKGYLFLPQYILQLLASYLYNASIEGKMDATHLANTIATLNSMTDVLTSVERIVSTPLPKAYIVHLKQCLYIYLLMLPLQLNAVMGSVSILGTALAAFIFVGVERIGAEIENPFGLDYNDLPLEQYIEDLRVELNDAMSMAPTRVANWSL